MCAPGGEAWSFRVSVAVRWTLGPDDPQRQAWVGIPDPSGACAHPQVSRRVVGSSDPVRDASGHGCIRRARCNPGLRVGSLTRLRCRVPVNTHSCGSGECVRARDVLESRALVRLPAIDAVAMQVWTGDVRPARLAPRLECRARKRVLAFSQQVRRLVWSHLHRAAWCDDRHELSSLHDRLGVRVHEFTHSTHINSTCSLEYQQCGLYHVHAPLDLCRSPGNPDQLSGPQANLLLCACPCHWCSPPLDPHRRDLSLPRSWVGSAGNRAMHRNCPHHVPPR